MSGLSTSFIGLGMFSAIHFNGHSFGTDCRPTVLASGYCLSEVQTLDVSTVSLEILTCLTIPKQWILEALRSLPLQQST